MANLPGGLDAATAPDLPFYEYSIPTMTGVGLPLAEFLRWSAEKIPHLAGLKYPAATLHEYQECVALNGGRFDVLYGFDELLLPALVTVVVVLLIRPRPNSDGDADAQARRGAGISAEPRPAPRS